VSRHGISRPGITPLDYGSGREGILTPIGSLGARYVVADLTEVTFIDSTALGVLIRAAKKLRVTGGALDLVCPNQDIRRLVQLTGLDSVFTLYTGLQEAMSAAPSG
jgi:anti-sigma B factor antagonist